MQNQYEPSSTGVCTIKYRRKYTILKYYRNPKNRIFVIFNKYIINNYK